MGMEKTVQMAMGMVTINKDLGTVITSEILNDRNILDRIAEKMSIDEDKNTEIVGLWTTTIMVSC